MSSGVLPTRPRSPKVMTMTEPSYTISDLSRMEAIAGRAYLDGINTGGSLAAADYEAEIDELEEKEAELESRISRLEQIAKSGEGQ